MKNLLISFLFVIFIFIVGCSKSTPTETIEINKVYYEGGPHTDSKGSYYTTVKIGDQVWLKENLNVGIMIQSSGDSQQTDNNIIEKFCYDNDENYGIMFGGLYQWNEAMNYDTTEGAQGICPDGWHIPTLAEFIQLANYVDSSSNRLKSIGQGIKIGAGTNTSGFSALLSGYRNTSSDFYFLSRDTYFWNSTQTGKFLTSNMGIVYHTDEILFDYYSLYCGFCIRCLKD